ncbi:MAG: TDP-N-acetylfucosamine:lipid II N-acetylfucosaminyltransferase [Crocinitomicaceae bacterium]
MILHIFHDNNFIELTKGEFDKSKNENLYVILSDKSDTKNDISHFDHQSLVTLIQENHFSCIVIHYLTSEKAEVILDSNYSGEVHWSIWGNDMYNSSFGFSADGILDRDTKKYLKINEIKTSNKRRLFTNPLIKKIAHKLYFLVKRRVHPSQNITKLLPKITSYSTVIPNEKDVINPFLINANYKPFTYGNLKTLIPIKYLNSSPKDLGNAICVGNSATPSNNHLSAFSKLDSTLLVRIPFAYGEDRYKKAVLKDFDNNDNFHFLKEYVPYEKYMESLTLANTLIINTHRQQAVGTILMGLYLGMRIYLNAKNPTYHFLKDLGVEVFDFFEDFDNYKNKPMTCEQVQNNQKCVEKHWGEVASDERMILF